MELNLAPRYINGYLTTFYNLDNSKHFKKIQDWNDVKRDYYIYLWTYIPTNTHYYIGKGVMKDGKFEQSRAFIHRKDMLSKTINPEEWKCNIIFPGISEKQAFAAEAYLISICEKNRSLRSQWSWDGESLINKRREWKHEELIEKYLIIDGNNYWETLRREINGYKRQRISCYRRICRTIFGINV